MGLNLQGFPDPTCGLEPAKHRLEPKLTSRLIRSTWDYLDEQKQFLEVLSQIEASSCRILNPLAAVRWNIDKHYLFDLEKWGVPIIPTYLASHVEMGELHEIFYGCEPMANCHSETHSWLWRIPFLSSTTA